MEAGTVTKVLSDFLTVSEGEICLKKGDIVQVSILPYVFTKTIK
jgi:hypothetical protein